MSDPLSIDFDKPIPLFPLPDCVLLPHATLPLHIFEQRYRRMTADALDSRGLIAMALFEGDAWRSDYEGKPPLRDHVCVGYINKHVGLADGRYHLLLQGLCRARIVREQPHDPYRLGMLEPTEREPIMEIELTSERKTIEALLHDPALITLAPISALLNHITPELNTDALVDLAAMSCSHDMAERYAWLAESDVFARAQRLTNLLKQLRQTVQQADRNPPSEGPDHGHVN